MTEQTKPRDAEAFAEELGPTFAMWSFADTRECVAGDLAERGAEDMAREFREAERVMRGFLQMAEEVFGLGTYMVLSDAVERAGKAREIAEKHAGEEAACT